MRLVAQNESKAAEANSEANGAGGKEWEANLEAKSAGGKEWEAEFLFFYRCHTSLRESSWLSKRKVNSGAYLLSDARHLKNLESTHHFLASLYTKTLLSSPSPWEGWGSSSIVLIHKGRDSGNLSNF